MDPNACLAEIQKLAFAVARHDKERRSELCRALVGWLQKGGFLPKWSEYPDGTKYYRSWVRKIAKFQDLGR